MVGRVKWFNNEKGYGFVEYKDNEDVFIHYSTIQIEGYKTLSEGQYVSYDLVSTPKGFQGIHVNPVKEPITTK
ncbi:MAG: cold shock domain-containing protein [Bacilli bacterium]|nr:cold shock domain-containing protein [Bacilli bacterium]